MRIQVMSRVSADCRHLLLLNNAVMAWQCQAHAEEDQPENCSRLR